MIFKSLLPNKNPQTMKRYPQYGLRLTALVVLLAAAADSVGSDHWQRSASTQAVPEESSALEGSRTAERPGQPRQVAKPAEAGYREFNRDLRWETRFDGRGFMTRPHGAAWRWGLELKAYGFPGQERVVAGKPCVTTAGQRVTYEWNATLQEWFVNDARGLEHGFTVRERPTSTDRKAELHEALTSSDGDSHNSSLRGASPLTFTLSVRGGLRPELQAGGRGVRFVDAQGSPVLTYSELTVVDANGVALPAWFEAAPGAVRLAVDERRARYPLTIDPIVQEASLFAYNSDAYDEFGIAMAVSGDTLVVGARSESSSATGVDGDQYDNSAENSGAAYIFVRDGTNWTQQAYLKASNTDPYDEFGLAVAISGNTVVIGARSEQSIAAGVDGDESNNDARNAGAAYVFVRTGTNWSQQAYLKASNTDLQDWFGSAVAISGDTVVIGAPGESSNATGVNGDGSDNSAHGSGAAYIFVRDGSNWTQQAYLKASNSSGGDDFGWSIAVSGDTVVVGTPFEDSNATGVNGDGSDNSATNSGAAYIFVRNGTNWSQQAYLKASNTGADDHFGNSVAVSGDTLVVGAGYESACEDSNATGVNGNQSNNSAANSGAAYVFVRSGTNWSQQAYLKASNTGAGDSFGYSAAISGDTVAVGAHQEDSSAHSVNGNQSNNSATDSGAAYVFVRNGTNWTQQAYLKASDSVADLYFGGAVAVSGGTVAVGAFGASSMGSFAGESYVFTGLGLGPRLTLGPDGGGGFFVRHTGAPEITYILQRAPSVTGPWSGIVTNIAPASGVIEYHETAPPPTASFYRAIQPQ